DDQQDDRNGGPQNLQFFASGHLFGNLIFVIPGALPVLDHHVNIDRSHDDHDQGHNPSAQVDQVQLGFSHRALGIQCRHVGTTTTSQLNEPRQASQIPPSRQTSLHHLIHTISTPSQNSPTRRPRFEPKG